MDVLLGKDIVRRKTHGILPPLLTDKTIAMYTSFDVANAFIALAQAQQIRLESMRLQLLVVLVHGVYMGTCHRPLFHDEIIAADLGPIVRILYDAMPEKGLQPVAQSLTRDACVEATAQANAMIAYVWQHYGHCTYAQLARLLCQKGSPWHTVWVRRCNPYAVIAPALIQAYYRRRWAVRCLGVRLWWAAR